jgi:hypothetical protein
MGDSQLALYARSEESGDSAVRGVSGEGMLFLETTEIGGVVVRHCALRLRPRELGDGVAIGFPPLGCNRKALESDGDELKGIDLPQEATELALSEYGIFPGLGGVSLTTMKLTGG